MKKIDTWLDIQRFVTEASQIPIVARVEDVELWARIEIPRITARKFFTQSPQTV